MRQLLSLLFLAALLLQRYERLAASPMAKMEDGSLEQDAFTSLLSDEMTDAGPGEGELTAAAGGRSRGQRVIVVADPGLWRALRGGAGGAGLYKRRADDQLVEHKDQELSIPILRRDTMRCMVGRVYRPCWEV